MGDSDDEHFVTFGTQLEPFEDDIVPRKKAVLIQDQFAVDEKGRRRFHGAFTGGFSAGYFNTVGTRDGWKPQQFKSSRSDKAHSVSQRPEDFMDDEDTSEFGIAPTAIKATDSFKDDHQKNLKRIRSRQIIDQPLPGAPVLQDFLLPARERIGIKLLKKMGWKPGQGIGPRVTKKEKEKLQKRKEILKKYGSLEELDIKRPSTSDSELSDDEYANIKLAPNDYEIQKPTPKDNYFGIEYVGLSKESVLSKHVNLFSEPTLHIRDNNKKLSIRGQAFGVGAFEAEDEDIYNRDDMSQYDFSLETSKEKKSRFSKEKEKKKSLNCLEGFVPATKSYKLNKVYNAPVLPKDFQPVHEFRKSRFFPPIEPPPPSNKDKPFLNAHSRARILSDPMTSQNLSPTQNIIIRTLNLHGKEEMSRQKNIEEQKSKAATSWMDKIKASNFVKGGIINTKLSEESTSKDDSQFKKPFAFDLDKQKRFEEYLELMKSGEEAKLASIQPLSMNDIDRDQERAEFEQAAKLQNANKIGDEKSKGDPEDKIDSTDPMKRAAKMKMFGKLTRKTTTWQPSSIVCKRFNVPEPNVGCAKPEMNKKKGKFSVFDSINWNTLSKFEKSSDEPEVSCNTAKEVPRRIEQSDKMKTDSTETQKEKLFQTNYEKVFQAEGKLEDKQNENDDKPNEIPDEENKTLEKQNDIISAENLNEKRDLFKSIFLSSSEESNSEMEDNVDDEAIKSVLLGKTANEINTQRNNSPPRGIFAKLDLDQLVSSRTKSESIVQDEKKPSNVSEKIDLSSIKETTNDDKCESSDQLMPEIYGPVLPSTAISENQIDKHVPTQKHIFRSVVVPAPRSSLSEGYWVEKTKVKKNKKEKKKHKHKDKEKKKKSKKKRH